MAQVLRRFYKELERIQDARKVAAIILETGEAPDGNGRVLRASADGHRHDRRRGLPLIGRGCGGAIPGTSPEAALLRKEAREARGGR